MSEGCRAIMGDRRRCRHHACARSKGADTLLGNGDNESSNELKIIDGHRTIRGRQNTNY